MPLRKDSLAGAQLPSRAFSPEDEEPVGGCRKPEKPPVADEAMEFIQAIEAYKREHGRKFPTWSEVLYILKSLGYKKE